MRSVSSTCTTHTHTQHPKGRPPKVPYISRLGATKYRGTFPHFLGRFNRSAGAVAGGDSILIRRASSIRKSGFRGHSTVGSWYRSAIPAALTFRTLGTCCVRCVLSRTQPCRITGEGGVPGGGGGVLYRVFSAGKNSPQGIFRTCPKKSRGKFRTFQILSALQAKGNLRLRNFSRQRVAATIAFQCQRICRAYP